MATSLLRSVSIIALAGTSLQLAAAEAKGAAAPFADPPVGNGPLSLVEDFEGTASGAIPRGFTKTGKVEVVDDVAHTGLHALRLDAVPKGPRRITLTGKVLIDLGGTHWGRLFFRVQQPVPLAADGFLHSTLVSGTAESPGFKDPIDVRLLDTLQGGNGTYYWLYNIQPKSRKEFATAGKSGYRFTDEWTLVEWHVDHATQTYRMFMNGIEVAEIALHNGAGNFTGAEIAAVFQSLSFGWCNYRATVGDGFVVWMDDLALAKNRIGLRGLIPAKTGKTRPGTP